MVRLGEAAVQRGALNSKLRIEMGIIMKIYQRLMIGVHSILLAMDIRPPVHTGLIKSQKLAVLYMIVGIGRLQLFTYVCYQF